MDGQFRQTMGRWAGLTTFVLVFGLFACGSNAPDDSQVTYSNKWTSHTPGGDTTCSDGTPYKFFSRAGDPEKLMVFFQGGGACWTRETCDPAGRPTYTVNISDTFKPQPFGAFNFSNPDNPFTDYTVVMAPYCTGDVHLGAANTVYPIEEEGQAPLTVRHQGRANAQAVLDWTYTNAPEAKDIFVTGSSAGAIPSPYYAVIIADAYPDARVAHLGDGAGGYRRLNADTRPDEQWGTFDFITQAPGFEALDSTNFNYEKLYIAAATAHPEITFAQYDAAEDRVQKNFLALSGIEDVSLLEQLNANHADILTEAPNFRSFVSGGTSHTILRRPEFYSYGLASSSVASWVGKLTRFEAVQDHACDVCDVDTFAGAAMPEALQTLWSGWQDPATQYVAPFKIFDNVYYVGIKWVSAYVIDTGDGLILIDSLYGKWINVLINNITKLGLNPADIKYVINTHGHFDHAGGSAIFQANYGARIVMAEEDWDFAESKASTPALYMPIPQRDIVAKDGDVISLGDTHIEMFKTPGHSEGVLSLRYQVRDGEMSYTAMTLGGVGLNFNGIARTETYLESYARLQSMQEGVSVSLPNHANMGRVLERALLFGQRKPGDNHPFVDAQAYQDRLALSISNAQAKLIAEKAGTAKDPIEELSQTVTSD